MLPFHERLRLIPFAPQNVIVQELITKQIRPTKNPHQIKREI